MRWLVLIVLSACATHDALHAERFVENATCSGKQVWIVDSMDGDDAPVCGAHVLSLGDGCYLSHDPKPHLYECAAATHGYLMCGEDTLVPPLGAWPFGDPAVHVWWMWLPDAPAPTTVGAGRCRERYEAWQIANLPPRRADISIGDWRRDNRPLALPPVTFDSGEYEAALARIVGSSNMAATVCPGAPLPAVTMSRAFPARFDQRIRDVVARVLVANHAVPDRCTELGFMVLGPQEGAQRLR